MSELFSSTDGNGSLAWPSNDSATPVVPPFSQAAMVSIGIVLAVIVSLTIAGNVLVLLAIAITPHLRGTTNYLVGSLAIADLMLGLLVLPFSAFLELTNYWSFGILFCDIWAAVDVLCCTASINSLCVISIDRYIGVTRPLQYPTIVTARRALITIVAVWLVSLALSLAPLIGWPKEPDPPGNCTVEKDRAYVIFSATISFYIPLAIICILYQRIYRAAAAQSRLLSKGRIQIKTSGPGAAEEECTTLRVHYGGQAGIAAAEAGKAARFKREQKAAKTLAIVVGVFAGCWSPFFILLPIEAYIPGTAPEAVFDFFFWLGYCNSCLNPFIYAFSSREFNAAFRRILRCQFRRRRGIPGNPLLVTANRVVGSNYKLTASPARSPTSSPQVPSANHRTVPSERPTRQPTLRIKTDDGDVQLDLLEESRV